MEITPEQLLAQWRNVPMLVQTVWLRAELDHGLPQYMLPSVASRETNMEAQYWQGALGDNGFAHGSFQLDSRFHTIPQGFDTNPQMQAEYAANELAGLHNQFGAWQPALAAYNSGRPDDWDTTHHDYGADVFARYLTLHETLVTARVLQLTHPYTSGNDVKFLQGMLNLKWHVGLVVDGIYGPNTEKVIIWFQHRVGIPVDGIVGPLTWAELAAN